MIACSKMLLVRLSWMEHTKEKAAVLHLLTVWGVKMWGSKMIMRQREQHIRNQKRIALVIMANFHDSFRSGQTMRFFHLWQTLHTVLSHSRKRHRAARAWEDACLAVP